MATQLVRPSRVERIQDENKDKSAGTRLNLKNIEKNVVKGVSNLPRIPLTLSIIKDLIDGAGLTGIALLMTIPISIISSGLLIYWTWSHKNFQVNKGKNVMYLILTVGIELIPGINLIPLNTLSVLRTHFNVKK